VSRGALIWVQHLLGSGHLRRSAAIARALASRGVETVIATGGPPLSHLDTGDARLVQLPPVRAADAGFSGLVDTDGNPAGDDCMARRATMLHELVESMRPAAVVTETFPFGRRQLRHEVLALIEAAALLTPRARLVASVRDILQRPSKPERAREMRDLALRHYDHVLVHGDPGLVTFADTFPHAAELGERVVHTGYIVSAPVHPSGPAGTDEIVVSAGGGAVGAAFLKAAIAARPLSANSAGRTWRVLSGDPNLAGTAAAGADGLIVEPNRADFPTLLANCAVSVSQGGYNTMTDLFQTAPRAVIAPYVGDGETEQTERARRLSARGLAVVVEEHDLNPSALAQAVDTAMASPRPDMSGIDLDGATRSADLLEQWCRDD